MHPVISTLKYLHLNKPWTLSRRVAVTTWANCLHKTNEKYFPLREDLFKGCYFIHNFLTHEECDNLIEYAENDIGYTPACTDYPPSYRNNDRLIVDDDELAKLFYERAKLHLPALVHITHGDETDEGEEYWKLEKINPRLRACRYLPGQYFNSHRDGVFYESPDVRSFLTFMVYLDESPAFEGGNTVFEGLQEADICVSNNGGETPGEVKPSSDISAPVSYAVPPVKGSMIIFQHDVLHHGAVCMSGTKHLMRSDVLYRRLHVPGDAVAAEASATKNLYHRCHHIFDYKANSSKTTKEGNADTDQSHLGYVWDLIKLSDGSIASCSRDKTIKVWKLSSEEEEDSSSQLTCYATFTGHSRSPLSVTELQGRPSSCTNSDYSGEEKVGRDTPSRLLISASRDRSIHIWNINSPADDNAAVEVIPDAHHGAALAVEVLSHVHRTFASAGADGDILLWRLGADWKVVERVLLGSHTSWVRSLIALTTPCGEENDDSQRIKYDLQEKFMVSGGEDGYVKVWQARFQAGTSCVSIDSTYVGFIDCVAPVMSLVELFRNDTYAYVAVGGHDGSIRICKLDLKSNSVRTDRECTHRTVENECLITQELKSVEKTAGDVRYVYDAHRGSVTSLIVTTSSVNVSNDNTITLLSGGEDRYLRSWRVNCDTLARPNIATGHRSEDDVVSLEAELKDHNDFVKCLCSTDQPGLFVSGSYDFNVKVRSALTLQQRRL